jgi:hypothetical protein
VPNRRTDSVGALEGHLSATPGQRAADEDVLRIACAPRLRATVLGLLHAVLSPAAPPLSDRCLDRCARIPRTIE